MSVLRGAFLCSAAHTCSTPPTLQLCGARDKQYACGWSTKCWEYLLHEQLFASGDSCEACCASVARSDVF